LKNKGKTIPAGRKQGDTYIVFLFHCRGSIYQ